MRGSAPLELDDDAQTLAAGLVADLRRAVEFLLLDEDRDLRDHRRLVDLERELRDDDALAPGAVHVLEGGAGADNDSPVAGVSGLQQALAPHDDARGGEVRPLDEVDQVVGRRVGMVHEVGHGVAHLA